MGEATEKISVLPYPGDRQAPLLTRLNNLGKHGGTLLHVVEEAYAIHDEYYNTSVRPVAVCKKHCSHCCYIPAQVSSIEVRYIEYATKHKAARLNNTPKIPPRSTHSPCPFLKGTKCSIYKYRPLCCRSFAVLDSVKFCIEGGDHYITGISAPGSIASTLNEMLLEFSLELKRATFADMRQWFTKLN